MHGIRLESVIANQIVLVTEFAVHELTPVCLLRLRFINRSPSNINLGAVNFLAAQTGKGRNQFISGGGHEVLSGVRREALRFFGHGWQSWSYAGVLTPDQVFPRSRLGRLSAPMQRVWGRKHPKKRGAFISDFYGVLADINTSSGVLMGFLSQEQAYGRFEVDLGEGPNVKALWSHLESAILPPGEAFETDWACIFQVDLGKRFPLDDYMKLVAAFHRVEDVKAAVSGWCSWYRFGQDISAAIIGAASDWVVDNQDQLPLQLIQIDDGYQQDIGDWGQNHNRFPDQLEQITARLHRDSLDAGIWLAPLIVLPGSELAREHPEWLLRDVNGEVVNAGFGWGRFFYALDGTHPGVKAAISKWVSRIKDEWHFDYLKLDFLYAGALAGKRFDGCMTSARALREVLADIRSAAGEELFLVGCGCPLGSGIGLMDSMRISPDVSEHWRGRYKGISMLVNRDPGFPSAWNAVRNTYYRAHQHGHWWLNDPDCLLLRERDSSLNADEVRSLTTMIALCGGVTIDSDDLLELSAERVSLLARLLPPINQRPEQPVLFDPDHLPLVLHHLSGAIGNWTLAAVFNFSESSAPAHQDCALIGYEPGDGVLGFEFWDQQVRNFHGASWDLGFIPAHGVALWSFREVGEGPLWIGDTIHISQGLGVTGWERSGRILRAVIDSGRVGIEAFWLGIPGSIVSARLDGEEVESQTYSQGIHSFRIQLKRQNHFELEWDHQ
jgi:alpha-galactosidase